MSEPTFAKADRTQLVNRLVVEPLIEELRKTQAARDSLQAEVERRVEIQDWEAWIILDANDEDGEPLTNLLSGNLVSALRARLNPEGTEA